MSRNVLIFLDIDGTLIQENQKPNTTRLPRVIKELSRKGFLFGLNSNRSIEDVLPIYTQFGLNGPLVLENGIYFKKSPQKKNFFIIPKPARVHADLLRTVRQFAREHELAMTVVNADTVAAIPRSARTKGVVIMVNKFRLFTGSVHIYRNGVRDRKLAV